MYKITLIAAIGNNNELGRDNALIWSIPEDLKFFRDNTVGKSIVMGMNTLKSLPRLLPDRKHIVLTRREVDLDSSIVIVHSIDELLQYIDSLDEEVMVIGGAQIYNQMIDYADKMLLTEINASEMADVYFPEFTMQDWDREVISNHQYENVTYSHVAYTRKRIKQDK